MTISEIATMAGVSESAVSRYFNGGSLSAKKAAQIKAIIDKTGYQPSAVARSLRTKDTRQIGVIVPKVASGSFSNIIEGINSALLTSDYLCLLANTQNNASLELKYLELFMQQNVSGIILLGTIITPEHKKIISKLNVPVVILGQKVGFCSCIYHDDYHAAKDITSHLLNSGVTHPAHIKVIQEDIAAGASRTNGYLDSLNEHGFYELISEESSFSEEGGFEAMQKILKKHPETDGVMCATDTIAAGAYKAIIAAGKRVPEDIKLTGIGDSPLYSNFMPWLSTIHYYYRESGQEAVSILLSEIEKKENEHPARQVMLGYKLLARNSC